MKQLRIHINHERESMTDLIKEKFKINRPFILNVGAFEERKNQLSLIEAFSKISKNSDHDLVLIGNGKQYLEECKNKALKLGLLSRIHFLSNVPFNDLPTIYQAADLFCFPSHFEGFGIPIIEAIYSKIPVITSLGSCFPESAGPDSEYIDPLSVQDIIDSRGIDVAILDVSFHIRLLKKFSYNVSLFSCWKCLQE